MARAATATELAYLRKDGQKSQVYLAVHNPAQIFKAQVNQTFTSYDNVAQVTYDNVTYGAYTDILPGMTVYVGTSPGDYDVGMVRVRKNASSTILYIGATSDIFWADDLYLTVVDEFNLWQRQAYIPSAGVVYMDYDVAYSDQHVLTEPVPVLGPDVVLWLPVASTVEYHADASASWCADGSTINAYFWTCPGAADIDDPASATPVIEFDTAGTYRLGCEVTSTNGKSFVGYRTVFVFSDDNPASQCVIQSCSGSYDRGGWSARVLLYNAARRSDIRDRAKVILFARDWYGADEVSLGPVTDCERTIMAGWIDGESIKVDPKYGTVEFTIYSANWWLDQLTGFPPGIEDTAFAGGGGGAAATWTQFKDLTFDKGVWHVLHWRSTATAVMDVVLTKDTRGVPVTSAPLGSIWSQVTQMMQRILAKPCVDRYNRLFVEIDTQYLEDANRASIPIVMDLTKVDWREQIEINRSTVDTVSVVQLNALTYASGSAGTVCAQGGGTVFGHYGKIERVDSIVVPTTAYAIALTGLILGQRNNEYPNVTIPLGANNRMIDIAPRQRVTMSLAAADNERAVTWTTKKLLPRQLTYRHNATKGIFLVDLEAEGETTQRPAVQTDCYGAPEPGPDNPPPSQPPSQPPKPNPTNGVRAVIAVKNEGGVRSAYICENIFASSPTWRDLKIDPIRIAVDSTKSHAWAINDNGLYYKESIYNSDPWVLLYKNVKNAGGCGLGTPNYNFHNIFFELAVLKYQLAMPYIVIADCGTPCGG